jgi:hypothetical protein
MRRLSLTLLVAMFVLPAVAVAARTTTGDGVLELRDANGTFTVSGRGVLWGQLDKGALRVISITGDTTGTGVATQPLAVSGTGLKSAKAVDDPNATVYTGTNLHFRVTGGKYRLRFKGSGVDLSAIGVGIGDLSGNVNSLYPGDYAVDGGKWQPIAWNSKSVPFGVQPPPPQTGP